jgi:asparagine synthetase B (glutamine-hydrolysing)
MRIVGRGPDLTVVQRVAAKLWLGFHRLSIVQPGDSPSGQPIFADGLAVVCNGESEEEDAFKAGDILVQFTITWS